MTDNQQPTENQASESTATEGVFSELSASTLRLVGGSLVLNGLQQAILDATPEQIQEMKQAISFDGKIHNSIDEWRSNLIDED